MNQPFGFSASDDDGRDDDRDRGQRGPGGPGGFDPSQFGNFGQMLSQFGQMLGSMGSAMSGPGSSDDAKAPRVCNERTRTADAGSAPTSASRSATATPVHVAFRLQPSTHAIGRR